jgi:protease-4
MPLEADLLIDRRRLKRGLAFWRALALLLLAGGVALLAARFTDRPLIEADHVARLEIRGFIAEDRKVLEALDRLGRDAGTRALIVAINSPGGTVAGGESLYDALRRLGRQKPVVAVMQGTAASAGYMTALGGRLRAAGADRRAAGDHRLRPAQGPAEPLPPVDAGGAGGAGACHR